MTLCVDSLYFNIRNRAILENISFAVKSGSVAGIIGPNGAGKSTLLKCIIQASTSKGSISFHNKQLSAMSLRERTAILGYVPQASSVIFPITVFDYILQGRRAYLGWKPREKDLQRVSEILNRLSIEHLALRMVNSLSGGERQMVLIARALVRKPGILLMDEPTNNLDIRHQLEMLKIIRELADQSDLTVLIAIHDINLALSFADKIIMINQGKIEACGSPQTVITRESILKVYGVDCYLPADSPVPFMVPIFSDKTGKNYKN